MSENQRSDTAGTADSDLGSLGPDERWLDLLDAPDQHFVLRLYVASLTPRSVSAIQSVKAICETHLEGRYELEVIDIYEQPSLARGEQIVAAPTLIRKLPLPLRRLIGDMADRSRVLVGLDLRPRGEDPATRS